MAPLHHAARCNNTEVTQLLLAHNGDIKTKQKNNGTPFHDTASNSDREVAKLLLEHNADIEGKKKIMEHLFTMLYQGKYRSSTTVAPT